MGVRRNPARIANTPTSGNQKLNIRQQLWRLLLRLLDWSQKELHLSCLLITRELATVKAIADEIIVMLLGEIIEQGPKDQVLQPLHHKYTDSLLSSVPRMDLE